MSTDRTTAVLASFVVFVVVSAGAAFAARNLDNDGTLSWPSSGTGSDALVALSAPQFEDSGRVSPGAVPGILETEWPAGSGQTYRHPTVIARYVHELYRQWLAGELGSAEAGAMERHADYLVSAIVVTSIGDREFGSWRLPMPNPQFGVGPGWTSAFTNAAGALALEQAARVFPERADEYRRVVELALSALSVDVSAGGVASPQERGVCFEEVAAPAEPTCILNGQLFVLGYLYSLAAGSSFDTRGLLSAGELYLRYNLDSYSTDFASLYSQDGKYAEPDGYNLIHGSQLLWLFAVTGNSKYYDTATLWSQFDGSGAVERIAVSRTVDPVEHGPELLSDGPAWYGYWSASGNAVIEIELAEVAPVCGFNMFYVEGGEPSSIVASVGGRSDVSIIVVDGDTSGGVGYRTAVVAYRIDSCVGADSLRLDLIAGDRDVVAVREIDVIVRSDDIAKERLRSMYAGVDPSYRERISLRSVGISP